MVYQIGDTLSIRVYLDDVSYFQDMTISYLKDDLLVTCGHCLPENSKLWFGHTIYTSGFETDNEGEEIGVVKIYPSLLHLFSGKFNNMEVRLNRDRLVEKTKLYLVNNGVKVPGKILANIRNQIRTGPITLNNLTIYHSVNKLNCPYFLVYGIRENKDQKTNERLINETRTVFNINPKQYDNIMTYTLSLPNYSGSPWLQRSGSYCSHVGIHIGKTIGYAVTGKTLRISEVAYLKPIIYHKQ